jgi:hypothetical protein
MLKRGCAVVVVIVASALSLLAQAPPPPETLKVYADLNQLMRGVLYPAANVVFSAQADNPAEIKFVPGHDPNMSTDPLTSSFGGWMAVENASLALAESANLLTIADRKCSNGVAVPAKDPAWMAFVQEVRDASMKAYAAAKAKDQDKIIETSEALSTSCSGCHRKFRDRKAAENRCKVS